jgi:hypothetical protein
MQGVWRNCQKSPNPHLSATNMQSQRSSSLIVTHSAGQSKHFEAALETARLSVFRLFVADGKMQHNDNTLATATCRGA